MPRKKHDEKPEVDQKDPQEPPKAPAVPQRGRVVPMPSGLVRVDY